MVHSQKNCNIAIFVSFSGTGGVERMIGNLTEGLTALGCQVDLLLVKTHSAHMGFLPATVNIVRLGVSHTMSSLPSLVRYLRRERPVALLATKDRANQVAILARGLAGVPTRVVLRMGTTLSAALTGKHRLQEWLWYLPMRLMYPLADAIVAVSNGVAADLAEITGLPQTHFQVIPNPVITPKLSMLAREPINHPWFADDEEPVIIGVGRLTRQKDFPTLLKAFALVRRKSPCRLIILGEGRDRHRLQALAAKLGVENDVDLLGFVSNPYAYMARADLFVLSSLWEGLGNVLVEALALGTPVVSTDCPSGPREVLQNGRYGRLVPVGDVDALVEAMLATLANPPDKAFLASAVKAYTVDMSSRQYLETLLGPNRGN